MEDPGTSLKALGLAILFAFLLVYWVIPPPEPLPEKSNARLRIENDSLTHELRVCREFLDAHLRDCAFISKKQIKERKGIYITLKRGWEDFGTE